MDSVLKKEEKRKSDQSGSSGRKKFGSLLLAVWNL